MKKRLLLVLSLILLFSSFAFPVRADAPAQATQSRVVVLTFDGALTSVWQGYLQRGIDQAQSVKADLIVIELNTPGGSIDLMSKLITQILASPVPTLIYVSPQGAMAGSAGTMLTLAATLSAMAPGAAIGAASPVGSQGENLPTTEELKQKEILMAQARSLAERRGPAAVALAQSTIENAKAASATEAKAAGMVDFVAANLDDLMAQVDGTQVDLNGTQVTVRSLSPAYYVVKTTFIEDILAGLTNPNIVFLLLSVGVQAILIELSNPGGWVAGFFGVIFLALAALGLGLLPVNYFGLIFIVLAFILFIVDIKAPTHGALTAAGTGSFIAGALVLFNSAQAPSFARVSVPLVIGVGLFMGATFFAVVMLAVRAMRTPVRTGRESLVGAEGYAVSDIENAVVDKEAAGIVQVAGERWSALLAEGESTIVKGEHVKVTAVRGVKLVVKRMV